MDTRNMKRIVDCLSPRDSLGFWGLEAVANELGLFDVAKDCGDFGKKLFEINSRILDLTPEAPLQHPLQRRQRGIALSDLDVAQRVDGDSRNLAQLALIDSKRRTPLPDHLTNNLRVHSNEYCDAK